MKLRGHFFTSMISCIPCWLASNQSRFLRGSRPSTSYAAAEIALTRFFQPSSMPCASVLLSPAEMVSWSFFYSSAHRAAQLSFILRFFGGRTRKDSLLRSN